MSSVQQPLFGSQQYLPKVDWDAEKDRLHATQWATSDEVPESTNEPLDPTFLRQRKMKRWSSTSAAAAVILQLLKSFPSRASPLIVLNLLVHDPSCLSCPCLSGKVQLRVWAGKVPVVAWRHLAIPSSTILANFDSNSHSKA